MNCRRRIICLPVYSHAAWLSGRIKSRYGGAQNDFAHGEGRTRRKNVPIPFYANLIICWESGWLFSLREAVARARTNGLSHRLREENARLNEAETGRARFSRARGKRRDLLPAELLCALGDSGIRLPLCEAVSQSVIKEIERVRSVERTSHFC